MWADGTSTQRYVRRASQVEPFLHVEYVQCASKPGRRLDDSLCAAGRDAPQWVTSSGRARVYLLLTSPWAECCEGSAGARKLEQMQGVQQGRNGVECAPALAVVCERQDTKKGMGASSVARGR